MTFKEMWRRIISENSLKFYISNLRDFQQHVEQFGESDTELTRCMRIFLLFLRAPPTYRKHVGADNNKSIAERTLRKRYLTLASSITDPYTV